MFRHGKRQNIAWHYWLPLNESTWWRLHHGVQAGFAVNVRDKADSDVNYFHLSCVVNSRKFSRLSIDFLPFRHFSVEVGAFFCIARISVGYFPEKYYWKTLFKKIRNGHPAKG